MQPIPHHGFRPESSGASAVVAGRADRKDTTAINVKRSNALDVIYNPSYVRNPDERDRQRGRQIRAKERGKKAEETDQDMEVSEDSAVDSDNAMDEVHLTIADTTSFPPPPQQQYQAPEGMPNPLFRGPQPDFNPRSRPEKLPASHCHQGKFRDLHPGPIPPPHGFAYMGPFRIWPECENDCEYCKRYLKGTCSCQLRSLNAFQAGAIALPHTRPRLH
jgi:hypothetical protein